MSPRPPRRICIAPCDVASYYSGLREGLERNGVRTWFFSFLHNPYARFTPGPRATWLERAVHHVVSAHIPLPGHLQRGLRALVLLPLRLAAFTAALCCCDVFIFGFSMSFFGCRELGLLKLLGKRIIVVFNGSDTRPPWMSGIFTNGPGLPDPKSIIAETNRQRTRLRQIERHADEIVCHPLSAQLLQRSFVNHLMIGHPFAPPPSACSIPGRGRRPLKVVHAPTRPRQKGSTEFRAIIAELRAAGHDIDYLELVNVPNSVVLNHVAGADLVLDELYSDIPLAGLGTEAAAFGVPVVVGGYASDALCQYLPGAAMPCDHYCAPDQVPKLVSALLQNKVLRARHAGALQAFVTSHWAPESVARRFLQVIAGEYPLEWHSDPKSIQYWQGWGAPAEATLSACAAVIAAAGPEALGINHNPRLLSTILGQVRLAEAAGPQR